jgi:hypothetical protein
MDAIVTAGGIPQPDDPLYVYSKGEAKALIDIAGKPMIQWVLDALSDAKNVDHVIIIGLSPKTGLTCKKPVYYISNQGKMLANMIAGVEKSLEINKKNKYVLFVSSDIPAVKPEMIDWLIETCMETEDDIYYGVCPREVMESRFPGSKRTYTHLKDMDVCGADMNIVHVRMASEHLDTWEALIANRKNPFAQAAVMGWDTLFLLLTRQATLQDFVERISKRIGVKGRAIVWEHAEPCMDVDKPRQLEMMREDLARSIKKSAPKEKAAVRKPAAKKAAKAKARN